MDKRHPSAEKGKPRPSNPLFLPEGSFFKQIMDLEARLHALQTELDSAPASMRQKNLDPSTWIPRNTARHSLSGHRMPVTGLAFHPTFTVIASCSDDATIKVWDWETGEFEQTIKGHTKSVHDVDFSFDGKLLSMHPKDCSPAHSYSILLF